MIVIEKHFDISELQILKPATSRQQESRGRTQPIQMVCDQLRTARPLDANLCEIGHRVLACCPVPLNSLRRSTAMTLAKEINRLLSNVIWTYPDRCSAFATLALQDPAKAARQLELTVQDQGFTGALIDANGFPLDKHKDLLPILEVAQRHKVPIYIHSDHSPQNREHAAHLAAALVNYAPRLKVILDGLDAASMLRSSMSKNYWFNTGPHCSFELLLSAQKVIGTDHILLTTDAVEFSSLPILISTHLSIREIEGLAWRNAVELLRI
jgi:hypothetical protein